MTEHSKINALKAEYERLMHAVQTGVAYEMEMNDAHTPKHLRTGVNSAMISAGAVAKLLIDKGLIDERELWTCLRDMARLEVQGYEARLSEHFHTKITLG